MPPSQADLVLLHVPVAQRLLNSTGHEVLSGAYATNGPPPSVLPLGGRAAFDGPRGIVPEYADAHRRYLGGEQARAAVRPTWVGTLDFRTRFPAAMSA